MVFELLGPSLDSILNTCSGHFTHHRTMALGIQMLTLLEHLHSRDFVHRDIKPENFLVSLDRSLNQLYMIDFGLARRYRDKKTGQHAPFTSNNSLTGTTRYVSVNTHLGIEQSRRDDIESLAYVLVFFARGALPWQGVKAGSLTEKMETIMEMKMAMPVEELCDGLSSKFSC